MIPCRCCLLRPVRAETGEQRVQDERGKLSLYRRKGGNADADTPLHASTRTVGSGRTEHLNSQGQHILMKKQTVREYLFNLGNRDKSLRRAIA